MTEDATRYTDEVPPILRVRQYLVLLSQSGCRLIQAPVSLQELNESAAKVGGKVLIYVPQNPAG